MTLNIESINGTHLQSICSILPQSTFNHVHGDITPSSASPPFHDSEDAWNDDDRGANDDGPAYARGVYGRDGTVRQSLYASVNTHESLRNSRLGP